MPLLLVLRLLWCSLLLNLLLHLLHLRLLLQCWILWWLPLRWSTLRLVCLTSSGILRCTTRVLRIYRIRSAHSNSGKAIGYAVLLGLLVRHLRVFWLVTHVV